MFFGMNRETDEDSLKTFLAHFGDDQLTQVLVPRMDEEEINQVVDLLMGIMKKHLKDDEYHRFFLHEEHHH